MMRFTLTAALCKVVLVLVLVCACSCQQVSFSNFDSILSNVDDIDIGFPPLSSFNDFGNFDNSFTSAFNSNGLSTFRGLFSSPLSSRPGPSDFFRPQSQSRLLSLAEEIYDRYYTLSNTSEVEPLMDDILEAVSILAPLFEDYNEFPFKSSYSNNEDFVDALIEEDPYLTSTIAVLLDHAYPPSDDSAAVSAFTPSFAILVIVVGAFFC